MDFVFASLIFVLLLGFTAATYSNYADLYTKNENKRSLEASALSISEILVKSPGYPENWELNASGARVIGLAKSENALDPLKVSAFDSLTYNDTRALLGIANDFYISIKTADGQMQMSKGTEQENASSVSIERAVYYNRSYCRLKVRIYE